MLSDGVRIAKLPFRFVHDKSTTRSSSLVAASPQYAVTKVEFVTNYTEAFQTPVSPDQVQDTWRQSKRNQKSYGGKDLWNRLDVKTLKIKL